MIPNRIAFAWVSDKPMSWLRLQSVQTFARHNPGWDITVIHERPAGDLPLDTQADLVRWRWLAERGGWFADTDIVFMRPMPSTYQHNCLTMDGGTEGTCGRAFAIGLMGAEEGTHLMATLLLRASQRATAADHQSAGTRLLAECFDVIEQVGEQAWDERTENLPARLLYPWGFSQRGLEKAWDPEADLPEGLLGLHWSGGHPASRSGELVATPEWMRHSDVPVARALRRAYA